MIDWSRIPSLSALRAFEATARCLNFTHAAQELNVTHAAIVQHVRALEAYLQTRLVQRQGRGLALTQPGEQLAQSLHGGFGEIARGVEALLSRHEDRPLNVTLTPAFAANWLMPRIGDFWARHPELSVNFNPGMQVVDLVADGFDLAIRYGNGDWPGHEVTRLSGGDFVVVAQPDLVAGRQVTCLSDLSDLPWLLESYMKERRTLIEHQGVDLSQVRLTELNTNEMVLSATLSGLGVSIHPRALVQKDIEAGRLTALCEIRETGLGYWMVTVPGREHPGLKPFMTWLRREAAKEG